MSNLHITNTDRFVEPYIKFVNKYFGESSNKFAVIINRSNEKFEENYTNINYIKNKYTLIKLSKLFYKCDHIYIHGLFNMRVNLLLFLQPWLLSKCSWIIWGADLYSYRDKSNTIKKRLYEIVRRVVIKNMGEILPIVEGDYQLAKKWYKTKAKFNHKAVYVNMIKNDYLAEVLKKENNKYCKITKVQLGNSATPSNNHKEILELLRKYEDKDIEIYCPLSYGDNDYAREVIDFGKKLFNEKFIPIQEYMGMVDYIDFMNNMDVAIFNNNRQQGLGNIYSMFYLGKKVYMRPGTTMWDEIQGDFRIFNINDITKQSFDEFVSLDIETINLNRGNIKPRYDNDIVREKWKEIFKD